jgi:hypothetical protein
MLTRLASSIVSSSIVLLFSCSSFAQTSVPYTERMEIGANEIFLGADAADEILVFAPTAGPLVLDGKSLNINAGKVQIDGDFIIRAHPEGKVADAKLGQGTTGPIGPGGPAMGGGGKGLTGGTGAEGNEGAKAGVVRLRFTEIVGPGHLIIVNNGGKGGKGQKGGTGGQGGTGGPGQNRSCNIGHRHSATPGGAGGPGGTGGTGGRGGRGGNAGDIIYIEALKKYVENGQLKLTAAPGEGGDPGEPGDPGPGGIGGIGGQGASCGGGGSQGGSGGPGEAGEKGQPGGPGQPGTMTSTKH